MRSFAVTWAVIAFVLLVFSAACGDKQTQSSEGPTANGGSSGSGGSQNADAGVGDSGLEDVGPEASCSDDGCEDGFTCTIGACVDGECKQSIGPSSGATACPNGTHCELGAGCVGNPICATDEDCENAWAGDVCKAEIHCNHATAICEFAILDNDADGHAPLVCSGDDCDDSVADVHPGASEDCDGTDDDCNGVVDNEAVCANPGEYCASSNNCVCKPENDCAGSCVDTQTDPTNCGGCGVVCPEQCVAGVCVCANGLDLCDGACLDTDDDPANCGTCTTDCNGAVCASGVCGPPPDEIAIVPGRAYSMAVSDLDVWVHTGAAIYKVAKAGGTPGVVASVASSGVASIAVDSTHAYWVDGKSVVQAPLAGGPATTLATKPSNNTADGATWVGANGTHVFWTDWYTYGGQSYVYTVPVGGGFPVSAATTYEKFESHFVNSALYYGEGEFAAHRVRVIESIGSGSSFTLANQETDKIAAIAALGAQTWWAVGSQIRFKATKIASATNFYAAPGTIRSMILGTNQLLWLAALEDNVLLGKTSTTTAASSVIGTSTSFATYERLAVDATHAYWTQHTYSAPTNSYTFSVRRVAY